MELITPAAPVHRSRAPDVEVAIIGAGPHGISAAVHLGRRGVHAQVFGEPMSFWKSMPAGMMLRSNLSASNLIEPVGPLSHATWAAERGETVELPIPLEQFVQYGMWVAQNAVPDADEREVALLERAGDGFALTLSDGDRLTAARVILAAGIVPFEWLPPYARDLPADVVSHTGAHPDLSAFRGRRVAVVGAGQSSLGWASLMQEHGAARVDVLVRGPQVIWLRGHTVKKRLGRLGDVVYAPTDVGPLWYSRLVAMPDVFRRLPRGAQDRIAARSIRPSCSHFVRARLGEVGIRSGVEITRVSAGSRQLRVALSDGTLLETDHLMVGTGYQVDFAKYAFLSEDILDAVRACDGYPVLGRGLETSLRGLHVAGAPAAWSFGPIMRFVSGSWYAGRALARTIASDSRRAVLA